MESVAGGRGLRQNRATQEPSGSGLVHIWNDTVDVGLPEGSQTDFSAKQFADATCHDFKHASR